jgi:hypothetical protein
VLNAATLAEAVASTPLEELPELVGLLEATKARALFRLSTPPPAPSPASAELVDASEMARRAGLTKFGIEDRARRGAIPSARVGRLRRFDPAAVLEALRKGVPAHNMRLCPPKKPKQKRLVKAGESTECPSPTAERGNGQDKSALGAP